MRVLPGIAWISVASLKFDDYLDGELHEIEQLVGVAELLIGALLFVSRSRPIAFGSLVFATSLVGWNLLPGAVRAGVLGKSGCACIGVDLGFQAAPLAVAALLVSISLGALSCRDQRNFL